MNLLDDKNKGLGYLEVYYEFKGGKVAKAALKFWSKGTGAVCDDWKVLDNSMAQVIRWELNENNLARVNNKKDANFKCGNANSFRTFLKSGKIARASLRYTNFGSPFNLEWLWVYYRVGRMPNYGSGNFMLLSQGKRASQSSTKWVAEAQYAVDGKSEGRYQLR